MAATIKIKNSSTAGAAPTSSDLVQGELAVNVTDKRLYTENSSGTVVELGTNPSVPVTFPDGSASAPSLTNDGDTNTGVFFPAADTVGITTGGTERARIDSSGNLGLGVTPSAWAVKALQGPASFSIGNAGDSGMNLLSNAYYGSNWTYVSTAPASWYQQLSGIHKWYNAPSGTAGNAITWTQAMTLDASGNLGLGTTSPSSRLDVRAAAGGIYLNSTTGTNQVALQTNNSGGDFYFGIDNSAGNNFNTGTAYAGVLWRSGSNPICFVNNSTERARIDSSGNLLVGTTSTIGTSGAGNTHIQGNTNNNSYGVLALRNSNTTAGKYFHIGPVNDNGFVVYNQSNTGVYITDGGTSWSSNSDERIKDIIEPITNAANKVSTLRAVIGKYKKDEDGVRRSFLIAQDVQAVLPEAVNVQQDEMGTLGVQYTDVIPLLVAAIKEQQAIITQLQADVAALKGQA